jgi:hypothetical protein
MVVAMARRACFALVGLSIAAACARDELYGARAPLGAGADAAALAVARPRLLSAHFARASVADSPDPDQILLVFSAEVDPTTLAAAAFLVVRRSGGVATPSAAWLAPANERDENRTVTLVGELGDPRVDPPASVRVVGSLHTEDGRPLFGLDASIRALEQPDEVVFVELLPPAADRCPGAAQVIRTYWTDALGHVGAEDLARVRVGLSDGESVAPVEIDDHAGLDDGADDNVLDLCLARQGPVTWVAFDEGVATDGAGHPCAAVGRAPDGPG